MTPFGGAEAVLDGILGISAGCGLFLGMNLTMKLEMLANQTFRQRSTHPSH